MTTQNVLSFEARNLDIAEAKVEKEPRFSGDYAGFKKFFLNRVSAYKQGHETSAEAAKENLSVGLLSRMKRSFHKNAAHEGRSKRSNRRRSGNQTFQRSGRKRMRIENSSSHLRSSHPTALSITDDRMILPMFYSSGSGRLNYDTSALTDIDRSVKVERAVVKVQFNVEEKFSPFGGRRRRHAVDVIPLLVEFRPRGERWIISRGKLVGMFSRSQDNEVNRSPHMRTSHVVVRHYEFDVTDVAHAKSKREDEALMNMTELNSDLPSLSKWRLPNIGLVYICRRRSNRANTNCTKHGVSLHGSPFLFFNLLRHR
ncbi:uncharacterized protein LOC143446816 [Clavelina lepadiformis]|uniref:uncharacterized protein LOC143446816 n=1 Tax=Clavelina lepadiformis TaxID=159417 RepID=UPI004041289D